MRGNYNFYIFLRAVNLDIYDMINCRSAGTLIDKKEHGESVTDMESLTIWLSLAATPLSFGSSAVTKVLTKGAVQNGRIFTQNARLFASALLCTTFGVNTALITLNVVNLIKKQKNDELTSLDVLQFGVSAFFFCHTLMQPKTASGVISRAQQMHFDKMAATMSDADTKKSFDKFLADNKVDGSIKDRSRIVRAINRMDDPNKFFTAAGKDPSVDNIKIGGRKGRTVLLSDQHGYGKRVKPNQYQPVQTTILPAATGTTSNKLEKEVRKKVRKCFDKDPSEVELNGEKIFEDLSELEQREVSRKLGGTARHNKDIAATALSVAEKMGYKDLEKYTSIVEVVANEVKGMHTCYQPTFEKRTF